MVILICIHSEFAMWNIPNAHVERLRRDFPSHTFLHARDDAEAVALIGDADAAFMGQITPPQLGAARRLRWIHSPAAGVGGMLFPDMLASPVAITNARGMSAETIAEHVLAVALAMFRHLPQAFRSQAARQWAQDAIGLAGNRTIAGAKVLVIGLGAIGQAVADRMTALGAHVAGVRRKAPAHAGSVRQVVGPDRLTDVLPGADIVVVCAPHTPETRGLIGAAEIEAMPSHAILINVSRGQLIDERALMTALRDGTIAGAALDVFVDEPLPADSPFWAMENVLITPHTSGFRPDHWDAATALFAENLRRFESGQPLRNVVDKKAGY